MSSGQLPRWPQFFPKMKVRGKGRLPRTRVVISGELMAIYDEALRLVRDINIECFGVDHVEIAPKYEGLYQHADYRYERHQVVVSPSLPVGHSIALPFCLDCGGESCQVYHSNPSEGDSDGTATG
ncbi:hypothetical protein SEA_REDWATTLEHOG_102 [Gordonia phage RedWattleHog]|uniref:Uncharacterized protein n=1 Tax=Gordonia phage Stormageddon TaxID=2656541 RepID=A0A649VRT2_9CAUD|nr:hypothetical protein KHQ86_gp200 [Gordonia phage Stormageddon]QGJ94961.1 hypothetical protein SEA_STORMAGEDDON_100 [Gordonia phage Stormageddon]QLF83605.1 hypothetical protein SEA_REDWATTLEHOG_102 [Gordonia phage RedWattleHog]